MDIIITGEQGAGKTRAAETLLSTFRPPYGKRLAQRDIFTIDYYVFGDAAGLLKTLVQSRCRAVLFDGCFTTPNDMLIACEAVKEYRKQINSDVLAIYVDLGANVIVTNGAGCTCSVPEILPGVAEPDFKARSTEPRTLSMLRDLVGKAFKKGLGAPIHKKLDLLTGNAYPELASLTPDQCNELHEYILKLLSNNG